jgi:hypothetical protein
VKIDPGPAIMRRLTNAEYVRAVRDVTGIDVSASAASLPADVEVHGFSNAAGPQTISLLHAERYMLASQQVASQLAANATARTQLAGCDVATGGPACLRALAQRLGRRAFRRPLQAAEVDRLAALAATESDPLRGLELVVQGVLQSPKFLFRPEVGATDAARPGLLKLTGHEAATRLAFFLLGGPPDDALLDAAGRGELDTPAGLEAAAARMLGDARARAVFRSFADQWLHMAGLDEAMRDTRLYPRWSPSLVASIKEELRLLIEEHVWRAGANFFDLYTSRVGFVDSRLAAIYGVPGPATSSQPFQRVDFGASGDRGGFFTTAAFAASTTRANETDVIRRGKFVRESMLCQTLPSPPPEAMERNINGNAACAGCHKTINPIGHGLERYDAIGALRATYPDGRPVLARGEILGLDPGQFSGGVELGRLLRASPEGQACAVTQTLRFALARDEEPTDACTLAQLVGEFKAAGFHHPKMVLAFVRSDAFRYRRPHAAEQAAPERL